MEAQWEVPGTLQSPEGRSTVVPYFENNDYDNNYNSAGTINEADESGYESGGAMTDYSTDYNDDRSVYTADSDYGEYSQSLSPWQEYWDEQAQAKYWYNTNTVRILLYYSIVKWCRLTQ